MPRDALIANSVSEGVTRQEIVDIALDNIGIEWTRNGCTDFVWGVSNLAGAPFFDLRDLTTSGDPTLPQDVDYVVPHSPGLFSSTDNIAGDGWSAIYSGTSASEMAAVLQPGDVVRVYADGNTSESSGDASGGFVAHSFIVVSVDGGDIQVVDNWNTAGIIQHSLDDIVSAFAPTGTFQSAFVSRLDESYTAANFGSDLAGNGFGDFSRLGSSAGGGSPTQVFLSETFDDGILNGDPWSYTFDVREENGVLVLDQNQTDLRSRAFYTFDDPVYDASIEFDRFEHAALTGPGQDNYYGAFRLTFVDTEGDEVFVYFGNRRSDYLPSNNNDLANYNHPILSIGVQSEPSITYFNREINSTDIHDIWVTSSFDFNTQTGRVVVDIDSDGLAEFDVFDERLIGLGLSDFYFDAYGWFTGHYAYIDNLRVTGTRVDAAEDNGFNIEIDYSLDSNGFFDDPDKRAVLEEAARIWMEIIGDEFADVRPGVAFSIDDPSNPGSRVQIELNESIDDLLIFVGSSDLGGFRPSESGGQVITGGNGGPEGFDAAGDVFRARIYPEFRGTPTTDFEPFVGRMTFNSNAEAIYSTDLNGPEAGKIDLLSTALHEIGHILGFGASGAFNRWVSNSSFAGPNTLAVNGGQPIPLESDGAHIADGFAGNTVLMDPLNFIGIRRLPSEYDLAILADIGYEVSGFSKQGALPEIVTTGDDNPVFGTIVDDRIDGLAGNDQLQGDLGNDELLGGEGNDTIFGQGGNDTLEGGADSDTLYGGTGTDTFRFDGTVGQDFIADFDYSSEVIEVSLSYGFSTIDAVLAAQSRPFTNATVLDLAPGQRVTIIDNPSGNTLEAANIRLIAADQPDAVTLEQLEYHARLTAYGRGDLFDGEVPLMERYQLVGSLANGFKILEIIDDVSGEPTFSAVALEAADGTPVLAVRGTLTTGALGEIVQDWLENADPEGIGYSEVSAAWPRLHAWLDEHPGAYIVGHSQGGAQAQLIASFAASGAQGLSKINSLAGVVTFNSPGIDADDVRAFTSYGNADSVSVTHFVSSGDVVSQAGESYLPGAVAYYDFDHVDGASADPREYFPILLSAHASHWSQPTVFQSISAGDQILASDPESHTFIPFLSDTSELEAPGFSHLYSGGRFDAEYFGLISWIGGAVTLATGFFGSVAGLTFLKPGTGFRLTYKLSKRSETEQLRKDVGELKELAVDSSSAFLFALNLADDIILRPRIEAIQSIASKVGVAIELAERFYDALVEFGTQVAAALETVSAWFQRKADLFLDWAEATWDGIASWSAGVWTSFRDFTVTAIDAIGSWTSEKWAEVKGFSSAALDTLATLSDAAWQATVDGSVMVLQKIAAFPGEMAALADDAWTAMADWTSEQWAAVADWTAETWAEAKDFSAAVWENTKTAAAGYFDNLKNGAAVVVNAVIDTYNEKKQQAENIRDDIGDGLNSLLDTIEGFNFLRDNPDAQVIAAADGMATSNSTVPAILVSTGDNPEEELTGSEQDDVFFPLVRGIIRLFNPTPQAFEASGFALATTSFSAPETGADVIVGTVGNLDGVQISGFGLDDAILITGSSIAPRNIAVSDGSALLDLDVDQDGTSDARLTLEGDFTGESFEVSSSGGDTVIRLAGPEASQLSAAGERFITSDAGANRVYGDDGDDVAVTGGGDDLVSSGAGSDVVVAGAGNDTIIGGLGADNLTGGTGADVFAFSDADFPGAGFTADFITDFTPGEDVIELSGLGFTDLASLSFVTVAQGDAIDLGGGRFIVLEGLTAGDLLPGDVVGTETARSYGLISTTAVHRLTDGEDRFISTDTGPSEIIGRAGADAIVGGSGNDTIRGEGGADVMIGGAGDDFLEGGQGADRMSGLAGADTFAFTSGEETAFVAEFITDYEAGIDTLLLSGFGYTSAADLTFTTAGSGDVALQVAPTRFIVFEGITDQTIVEDDAGAWVYG